MNVGPSLRVGASSLLSVPAFVVFSAMFGIVGGIIAVIVVLGVLNVLASCRVRDLDIMRPHVLLPLMFTFYALGPLFKWWSSYDHGEWVQYLSLMLTGMLALKLGLYVAGHRPDNRTAFVQIVDLPLAPIVVIVLACFAVLSIFSFVEAIGGLGASVRLGYGGDRYVELESISSKFFGNGFYWMMFAILIMLFYRIRKSASKRLVRPVLMALALLVVFYQFMTGARSDIINEGIFFVVLYHYGIKRISSRVIFAFLVCGLFIAQYWSFARFYLPMGFGSAILSPWKIVLQEPWLLLPINANEFMYPAASLLEIIHAHPDYWLGAGYIPVVTDSVPFLSRLVGTVGTDPMTWRMLHFYPKIAAAGGGYGFSPVAEGYLNFGAVGVILQMFVYGYLAGWLFRKSLSSRRLWGIVFWAGALPTFMFMAMRVDFTALSIFAERVTLFPALLCIVLGLIVRSTVNRAVLQRSTYPNATLRRPLLPVKRKAVDRRRFPSKGA